MRRLRFSEPVRIALTSRDLPSVGQWGVARHIALLIEELSARFVPVLCGPGAADSDVPSGELADRHLLTSNVLPTEAYVDFEYLLAWNCLLAKRMTSHFASRPPGLVHNHGWMTFPAALAVAREYNIPLITTIHFLERQYVLLGLAPTAPDLTQIVRLEEQMLRESEVVIVPGASTAQLIASAYRAKPRNLVIIAHGVHRAAERTHWESEIVLFVGRLAPEKGIRELLDAFAQVAARRPYARLRIAGRGPLESTLRSEYEGPTVTFLGYLNREELAREYLCASVFCSPSASETFGLASLEAAAEGLAVVISTGPGIEEIFSDREALLVPAQGDQTVRRELLISHLERILADPRLRRYYGRRAQRASRRFSVEAMVRATEKIYAASISQCLR